MIRRRWKVVIFAGIACTICAVAYMNIARDSLNWIRDHGGLETQETVYAGCDLTPIATRHTFRFKNIPTKLVGEIKAKSNYGDPASEGGAWIGGINVSVDRSATTVSSKPFN